MDGKRLLAEATAERLRKDAQDLRSLGGMFAPVPECLLRLAALAEAVSRLDELHYRHVAGKQSDGSDADVEWYEAIDTDRTHFGNGDTPCAALSTLLPTEDTTDGR